MLEEGSCIRPQAEHRHVQVPSHSTRIDFNSILAGDFLREGTLDRNVSMLAQLASLGVREYLASLLVPAVRRILRCDSRWDLLVRALQS